MNPTPASHAAAQPIVVLGAGAWGTALARHAAARHPVVLWTRDPAHAQAMRTEGRNARYLPGVDLPEGLHIAHELRAALAPLVGGQGLLVVATSVAGLRPTVRAIRGNVDPAVPVLWLCKGLERGSGLLPHQIVVEELPGARCGVLSGPSFAQEVAAGLPVALTVAAADEAVGTRTVAGLHHGAARIYRSDDVVGVEVGGALKNVMAIAAGICDGLALGHNARAALITRGLAETTRFGVALGARAETFNGLTGLGDLVLTCTGDLSRNRRVGLALAAGRPLQAIVDELGHVAEGVACAEVVHRRAAGLGIEVPIISAVLGVLSGRLTPRDAVLSLLAREPRRE